MAPIPALENILKAGIAGLKNESRSSFQDYCKKAEAGLLSEDDERQISLDLARADFTVCQVMNDAYGPTHVSNVCSVSMEKVIQDLQMILRAFCIRRKDIGYVQGFSDIAIVLYVVLAHDVTSAFWAFSFVLERHYPRDFYSKQPKLHGFHLDMEVFCRLAIDRLSKAVSSMSADEISSITSLLAFKWFIPLWVGLFPFASLKRLWAYLLGEDAQGCNHLAFALAIMQKCLADDGVASTFPGDAASWYKFILESTYRLTVHEVEQLTERAERFAVHAIEVDQMREEVSNLPQFQQKEISALQGLTHFSHDQLCKLQREFRFLEEESKSSNGGFSRGVAVSSLGGVLRVVAPTWPPAHVDRLAQILDPHHEGYIPFHPLILCLSALYKGTAEEKLRLIFDLYDEDASGFLEIHEIFTMAEMLFDLAFFSSASSTSTLRRSSSMANLPLRGRALSDVSVPDEGHSSEVCAAHFVRKLLKMDLKGDKRLSFEEWRTGALTDPTILNCLQIQGGSGARGFNRTSMRINRQINGSTSCLDHVIVTSGRKPVRICGDTVLELKQKASPEFYDDESSEPNHSVEFTMLDPGSSYHQQHTSSRNPLSPTVITGFGTQDRNYLVAKESNSRRHECDCSKCTIS